MDFRSYLPGENLLVVPFPRFSVRLLSLKGHVVRWRRVVGFVTRLHAVAVIHSDRQPWTGIDE